MRRLILLRHAKTETDAPSGKDRDRRLDERGRADAAVMGAWLAAQDLLPDQVLVSTATRTRQTWDIVESRLPSRPAATQVDHLGEMYNASASQLLQAIHDVSAGINRLMLIGHNPGLHELALGLTCRGDSAECCMQIANMPTSALAVIDFPIADWADAGFGSGKLQHYVSPKSLHGAG